MQKMETEARMRGVDLETAVPQGQPDQAIIMFAQAKKVNLIILGSHGRTGLRKLLMGSVVRTGHRPGHLSVLVVKKKNVGGHGPPKVLFIGGPTK